MQWEKLENNNLVAHRDFYTKHLTHLDENIPSSYKVLVKRAEAQNQEQRFSTLELMRLHLEWNSLFEFLCNCCHKENYAVCLLELSPKSEVLEM